MAFFDLLDGIGIVVAVGLSVVSSVPSRRFNVRCDWDVSAVKDCSPAVERVGVKGDVVAAAESDLA